MCMLYSQFNTRVLKVSKTEDHASTGRWRLSLKTATQPVQGGGGESLVSKEWEEEFDGVIAATGWIACLFLSLTDDRLHC